MRSLKKISDIGADVFSAADARAVGISTRVLHYLCAQGKINRVGHGFYDARIEMDLSIEALIHDALVQIDEAVVCMKLALWLYDLTDEAPEYLEFFSPRVRISRRKIERVRIYSMRRPLVSLDTKIVDGFRVTSFEQTLVDLLRYDYPLSRVLEAIEVARGKGIAVQIGVLRRQGEVFRAKGKTRLLLEALV